MPSPHRSEAARKLRMENRLKGLCACGETPVAGLKLCAKCSQPSTPKLYATPHVAGARGKFRFRPASDPARACKVCDNINVCHTKCRKGDFWLHAPSAESVCDCWKAPTKYEPVDEEDD